MANVSPILIRGTNNTGNASQNAGITPSRLLLHTDSLRNDLQSRNLYTPDNLYPITEKSQAQNIINAVNGIASIIAPFKAYDLSNTVYGRLITTETPLTTIGLAMLGKQFAMNAGSHIAQQNFPTIKLSNLFSGGKLSSIITKNIDLRITKKPGITNFQQFLNSVIYSYPGVNYPFKPTLTEAVWIQETGVGQLGFLYRALNQNIYKEGFNESNNYFGQSSTNDAVLNQYSGKKFADIPMTKRNALIYSDLSNYKFYFNYFISNPYSNITPKSNSITSANAGVMNAMNYGPASNQTQEYAPTAGFIEDNFGTADINFKSSYGFHIDQNTDRNAWINDAVEFDNDILNNKLVWGKNNVSVPANDRLSGLRGNFTNANNLISVFDLPNGTGTFNANAGLLEYTRNLLNASEGAVVDITRKAFIDKNKYVKGFNGSGLWQANTSKYIGDNAGKTGIRQSSMLDQYDRFTKTIRFNGNYVYNGNQNSVIFDRVTPRIHPTMPVDADGVPNNKNLMFSIENLAVRVISNKDGVGIIDDEYGSQIPVCEVGQFNGRLMWFPPYNLELNESTAAKYESTVMVGRNEPMYNYMYSERSATLTFTLLIDYPQNLKNLEYKGTNKHRDLAEFFAFGGNPYDPNPIVPNVPQKIRQNIDTLTTIIGPVTITPPQVTLPIKTTVVFPNDLPRNDVESTNIINTMFFQQQYQIEAGSIQSNSIVSSGLNHDIYYVTGMTGIENIDRHFDKSLAPGLTSQYTYSGVISELDKKLNELFKPEENRKLYYISIVGAASKLNDKKRNYNKDLGQRRANALKIFIMARLAVIFPDENLTDIQITTNTVGATGADPANSTGKTQKEINDKLELVATTKERYATIEFKKTQNLPEQKKPTLSEPEVLVVTQITNDNQGLAKMGSNLNSNDVSQCVMNDRKDDQAIQKGFQSIEGNYYNPVFHSQTPEDFHRRLTFLQQCMRQGAAKRYDMVDENGIPRAKNSAFGRQPICILRVADFFFTKVVIENLTVDYSDTTWDMNPEGFGMQPMIAKITLQMKVIGGQSLKGPIDALQNAITFNHYANSNYTNTGLYQRPAEEADNQEAYINGILATKKNKLATEYNKKFPDRTEAIPS
jgi:hypothetical protein